MSKKHNMRAGVKEFFNLETEEVVYGVAIQMGYRLKYCKCVIGHLNYKTKQEAIQASKKIQKKLDNLDDERIKYLESLSKTKYEYIHL